MSGIQKDRSYGDGHLRFITCNCYIVVPFGLRFVGAIFLPRNPSPGLDDQSSVSS